ncbi:hypothetical protein WJX73_010256 [Symbiochloris irregularis]|uniref:Uncharacterized protein n=1 Tax=Symbiochloris irregularis TaxID=706552 RepID=A0AAW1P9J1_9CHLO
MVGMVKIIAIAAVGGTAWLFMRPRFSPILPPNPPGRWQESPAKDPALLNLGNGLHLDIEGCLKDTLADEASQQSSPEAQGKAGSADILGTFTENEIIVHNLLLQDDRLTAMADDPQQSPLASVSQELRGVAEQAFWDVLREGLEQAPPQWVRLVALVVDSRDQLADLIPKRSPAGQGLLADMMDKLDEGYVRARLEAGFDLGYLRQLLDYLVYVISSLQAPVRREASQRIYEELGRDFDLVASQPEDSSPPSQHTGPVRLSMEVRRSTEVPVRVQVRDAWHPVDLPEAPPSPARPPSTTPHVPFSPSRSLFSSRAPSPSCDWVTSFSPAASPRPGGAAGGSRSETPTLPLSQSWSQVLAKRDPWVGVQAPPEPQVGAPMEEEVEVKFGLLVERDDVIVHLQEAEAARRSSGDESSRQTAAEGETSAGPQTRVSARQAGIARVVVKAAQFVLDSLRQLRTDAARAHLELLKGLLQGSASGIEYERRRFVRALEGRHVRDVLPRTCQWLRSATTQGPWGAAEEAPLPQILVQGTMALIQHPQALSFQECPEALLLDCKHLVALQNELQRLSLVAAALLVSQQLLETKGQPTAPSSGDNARFYSAVKQRFLALLATPGVQMPQLMQAMGALLAQRLGQGALSQKDEDLVSSMIRRLFDADNPIYQKVQSGIVAGLKEVLTNSVGQGSAQHSEAGLEGCRAKLGKIGGELLLEEVASMADFICAIVSLNLAVCEPFYCTMIAGASD